MLTRKLGYTGLELTTIGLGTWAMGGGNWKYGWGPQDDRESIDAIHQALELGVNWIDTAPIYGLSRAETVVGKALEGLSERPILATKLGRQWDEAGNPYDSLKRASIREKVEESLCRLGVEAIDLYQIHWPIPDEDIEEGWGAMAELVREGKVRYLGVCNFNLEQLERIQPIYPVASLQPPYSMLHREVEADLLPYCARHGIGVVAYSPMQKGLLTDKLTRAWASSLPVTDHRSKDPMFQEPQLSANLELVEGLKRIAARSGRSVAQLAIAWTLRRPEVTSAIVGARRPDQIVGTAPAGEWTLSGQEIEEIGSLLADRQSA